MSPDSGIDAASNVDGVGGASEIAGSWTVLNDGFNRLQDGRCSLGLAEAREHQSAGPDLAEGIGDAFTSNVRRVT